MCTVHCITSSITQRKCPDCPLTPALCQTLERDCHSAWHNPSFSKIQTLWYEHVQKKEKSPKGPCGRPKGSINRRRRRGMYRSHPSEMTNLYHSYHISKSSPLSPLSVSIYKISWSFSLCQINIVLLKKFKLPSHF